jgi:hypothetical protein
MVQIFKFYTELLALLDFLATISGPFSWETTPGDLDAIRGEGGELVTLRAGGQVEGFNAAIRGDDPDITSGGIGDQKTVMNRLRASLGGVYWQYYFCLHSFFTHVQILLE